MYQSGWALLSRCLAILVACTLLLMSIKTVQLWTVKRDRQAVVSDLDRAWSLASDYYAIEGCYAPGGAQDAGIFAGKLDPTWAEVSAVTGREAALDNKRDPWIAGYHLRFVQMPESIDDEDVKPRYQVVIEADLQARAQSKGKVLASELGGVWEAPNKISWEKMVFLLEKANRHTYHPTKFTSGIGILPGENKQGRIYCH